MLDFGYLLFIGLTLLYWVASPRKEVPFLILLHSLTQYFLTLFLWRKTMDGNLATALLLFLVGTTILMVWARGLRYNRETQLIRSFFTVTQWVVLIILAAFVTFRAPFTYPVSTNLGPHHAHVPLVIGYLHPMVLVTANLLLFSTFLASILHWGERYSIRRTLFLFGPALLYLLGIMLFIILEAPYRGHPFA